MRTAIVADWLYTYGGAEHVLTELRVLFPEAPIFTTLARHDGIGPLRDADIRTTWLQKLYRITGNHQVLLPLMPQAIESIDLTGFDLVISSSHAVTKGVIIPPNALHVCYCHTPMRYAWEMEEEYLNDFHIPKMLRKSVKKQLQRLRRWDMTSAKRVDVYIANSTTTQERIKRIYNRDSIVIAPPVEERFFEQSVNGYRITDNGGSYFLAVSRLVPYKRIDLLIEVANELKLPLKIAGRGQDSERLKKLAGPTVELLGFVPDDELPSLYVNASALLFPQYEDAGIVPLEAQACGTPVIAYRAGGATDAVKDGVTGLFFDQQNIASIREALERFNTHGEWNREVIRSHAKQFAQTEFRNKMSQIISQEYERFAALKQ